MLIENAKMLERFKHIDAVVVDKTSTLNRGRPDAGAVLPVASVAAAELLRLASALERQSQHPLAGAVVKAAEARGLAVPDIEGFQAPSGRGVVEIVEGRRIAVGSTRLMSESGIAVDALTSDAERVRADGVTVLFVAIDGKAADLIAVADPVKESTHRALAELMAQGARVVMLIGDNRTTASAGAKLLGISEVEAEVLPEEKQWIVERMKREGRRVVTAGDGVDDAPALAAAEIGIAVVGRCHTTWKKGWERRRSAKSHTV